MANMMIKELDEDDILSETMTVEIAPSKVKRLQIGQRIEITVKGTVGMLQVPPGGPGSGSPSMLGIRVIRKTIRGLNQIDSILDDVADEEEDDG